MCIRDRFGDVCTRSCGFCHVKTGKGGELDWEEPARVAKAVEELQKNNALVTHVVITSVNRDDRNHESACIFAQTVNEVRSKVPGIKIEVLIPDFKGEAEAIEKVIESSPDVLNHNIKTVPRLYSLPQKTQSGRTRSVRPQAVYQRSLELLSMSASRGNPAMLTKSGIMVGLGESYEEIIETLADLKRAGCDIVTIGQYLQPTVAIYPYQGSIIPSSSNLLKTTGKR